MCACFGLRRGPATLLAFTPHGSEPSGFRYVVAEAELTEPTFLWPGAPNGASRFAGWAGDEGFRRWALASADHHSPASLGLFRDEVAHVAASLGVGCARISRYGITSPPLTSNVAPAT